MAEGNASRSRPRPDFADLLRQVIEPSDADEVGAALQEALQLDDESLADFLEALSARVRSSGTLIRAEEVRRMVHRAAGEE